MLVANINPTVSIITLNANGLNNSIIRQIFSDWEKKIDPTIYCLCKRYFRFKHENRLTIKGWKKMCNVNNNHKREEMVILILENRY